RHNDVVLNEFIWFVDPSFANMFSYPIVSGSMSALNDKTKIILTTEIAEKYFGDEPALGKPISIKFQNEQKREFIVGAVIQRPATSSMFFTIFLPIGVFEDLKFKDSYDWSYMTDATFILLKEGRSVQDVQSQMNAYKELQNASLPQWRVEDFELIPLDGLSRKGFDIVGSVTAGSHPQGIYALSTIAVLLLLLSCFNYMNISVATISTRLKEIGIRKVVGSGKRQIIQQFLTENLLLTVFAMGSGALLSYLVFLPGLNTLFPISIPFAFSSGTSLFLLFFGLLLFVSLVSGVYPAFYVSSFQPVQILKGKGKFGQRSLFSRILLTLQFVLAFTLIVGCFVFIDNAMYLKNKDWGYSYENNYSLPLVKEEQFAAFRDKANTSPNVASYAGSLHHIGYSNPFTAINTEETNLRVIHFKVGGGYLETMNIQLKEGRYPDEQITSDYETGVIINEIFAERMKWAEPLEQSITIDSVRRFVIGVVKNFHHDGFYDPIEPVMFTLTKEETFRYLNIKASPGNLKTVEASMKNAWKEIAPDDPYEGFIQEKIGEDFQRDNTANMKLLVFISGMALILSCLGLFGLVSYNITRRQKEFSIRKVFGANTLTIFRLMNRDYTWILGISFFLGAPTGFLMMNTLIQHIYPDPQSAGPTPFIIAVFSMVITVGITIASQMHRIVKENPTVTLRNE
ncbi:MAG: ABC transporter permease, partial [Cyclobacteriaceae bacterium]|nr:ABC transporter permease [Cyclobacteriaceae bacterium]